jgi:hypothetical protein
MSRLQRNNFKVKLFMRAIALTNWLATLPNKLLPPPFRLIQIGSAYWHSRALYAAAKFAVAEALGDDEKCSDELAHELALNEDHLYRLLRMLASLGIFEECAHRRFRNNRLSERLRHDHPQSVRAMVLMHNSPEISRAWFDSLEPAIRTGEVPFILSHGEELFFYMNSHPDFDVLFTNAMEAVDGLIGSDYLDDFDWGRFERLIDVGGGNGSKSAAILQKHPYLNAVVFDRPPVVADATNYWRDNLPASVLRRLNFSGGDMFEAIPQARSKNDLYLFAAIFHGLGKQEAQRLLGNLRVACGTHRPTIVIADMLAQEQGIDPSIASFDMQMLINTRGRERTLAEWRELLITNGFTLQEIVDVRTFAKLFVIRVS